MWMNARRRFSIWAIYLRRTKSVITLPATTLQAIEKVLNRLVVGGRLAIMVYYGHEGGALEKDAVLDFISQLDQTVFTAMLYKPINQVNTPPFLVMVED